MMRKWILWLALLSVAGCMHPPWSDERPGAPSHREGGDAAVVRAWTPAAKREVEAFFGRRFPRDLEIVVVPDRRAFTAALPPEWGLGETECWMVGVGVADRLVLLSPSSWRTEACEHDPDDASEAREIFVHELVHSYHGQNNPSGDFSSVEGMDWFIEGLAVYAAGQLKSERQARIRLAAREARLPRSLDDIWRGPEKYGQAGSLVAYIDAKYGRGQLRRMLPVQSRAAALASLGVDEPTLLLNWAIWAAKRGA